jgi:hypothetical protein
MSIKSFLKEKIKEYKISVLLDSQKISLKERIYLFADPRSGSTWVAEMLCKATNGILIDEPLNINNSEYLKDHNFYWRQEIPHDAEWPEIELFFQNLKQLKGKGFYPNLKANAFNQLLENKHGVYKIIRGKMLLSWFLKTQKPALKPIVLIRNPFASIASQLSHGSWNYPFLNHETPTGKFHNRYHKYDAYLKSLDSKAKKLTAHWCISNNFLLDSKGHWRDQCHFITYEEIIKPENESLIEILKSYRIEFNEAALRQKTQASSTSDNQKGVDPIGQIHKWKDRISKEEILGIEEVLTFFGMENYEELVKQMH